MRKIPKIVLKKIIKISAKTQDGVDELLSNMVKMVSNEDIKADGELLIINVRHKGLIAKAKDALQKAMQEYNASSLLVTSKDEVKLLHSNLKLSVMRLELKINPQVLEHIKAYVEKFK